MHATEAKKAFEHIPVMENPAPLADYDAIIIGTGTRFGLMSAQMKTFFDHMGQLWQGGKLIGKIGSVFTSTATQHGGQVSPFFFFFFVSLSLSLSLLILSVSFAFSHVSFSLCFLFPPPLPARAGNHPSQLYDPHDCPRHAGCRRPEL